MNTWLVLAARTAGCSGALIVVMMIMEVAGPGGRRFTKALVGAVVASSVSFAIYFAIAAQVFLDVYRSRCASSSWRPGAVPLSCAQPS